MLAAMLAMALPAIAHAAPEPRAEVVRLWPGKVPGTESWSGQETERKDPTNPFGPIILKSNVTEPSLTVVRPAPGRANGTAIIILPGGGFQVLAWDIEGTEVARHLAARGITAFVLKYRVRQAQPAPGEKPPTSLAEGLARLKPLRKIAIEDAAQAVRLVRRDAARYGIRPDRVGMMGFSAGAITTVGLLVEGDPAARPNFAAPIYGAPLMDSPKVPADAPPLFIASAQDDFLSAGSIEIYNLWNAAQRPAELHNSDKGGHGFGMRAKDLPVGQWPAVFDAWLSHHGYLPASAKGR
jgi:acetyl esterase/lipase